MEAPTRSLKALDDRVATRYRWRVGPNRPAEVPFETGTLINVTQIGSSGTTVQAAAGVSLNGVPGGSVALDGEWSGAALRKRGADTLVIQGALAGALA